MNEIVRLNKHAKLYGKLDKAIAMYRSGKSVNNIAKTFKLDRSGAYRALFKAGVKFRTMSGANTLASKNGNRIYRKGKNHASWKTGKTKHESGYILIKQPGHHRAHKYTGYVFEHIVILEIKIGRKLKSNECSHHINEIKDDNRPENLKVMTKSNHMRYHGRKKY